MLPPPCGMITCSLKGNEFVTSFLIELWQPLVWDGMQRSQILSTGATGPFRPATKTFPQYEPPSTSSLTVVRQTIKCRQHTGLEHSPSPLNPINPISNIIWYLGHIPRQAFILWLASRGKLNLRQIAANRYHNNPNLCVV